MTKFRITTLAAALALGLGAVGTAHAGALAQSVLEISNLFFISGITGEPLNESDFSSLVAKDTTDAKATLNGTTATDDDSVSTFPFTLDLAQQCVGGAGVCASFGENNFDHAPPAYTPDVARADTLLSGDPINFDVSGAGTGATGANAAIVGESELTNPGDSTTQANLGLQADFVFALEETQAVTFNFDADGYLIAFLGPLAAIGSSAQASYSFTLAISGPGVDFTFAPTCLNDSVSTLIPNTMDTATCVQSFSATSPTLEAGTLYHFSIRQTEGTDTSKVLAAPEPASLALLGVGLLGMFGVFRARNKA